jgi:hypothetical protein
MLSFNFDVGVMMKHKQMVEMLLLLFSVLLLSMQVNAFASRDPHGKYLGFPTIGTQSARQHERQLSSPAFMQQNNKDASTRTQLYMSSNEPPQINDGTGRGLYILGIVLLACVWSFTVPPKFRRAYICSDRCAVNREAPQCNNCVTSDEWTAGIKEYYANGGGIQWDFSIDPNSKMKMF